MSALPKITFSFISNSLSAAFDSRKKRLSWAVFILCFIFLNFSLSLAETGFSTIPPEFGKVIYRCNPISPNQLFIIGMAHRDSLTGLSVPQVSKTQAQIYKLGEWLIQHERCELLLPEGFFASATAKTEKEQDKGGAQKAACSVSLDIKTLEEKLSDNRSFVNAELLLKRNYPLRLRQVEDPEMHRAVGALIRQLVDCESDKSEFLRIKSDLACLQERRTAAMLQKIPGVIQSEFQEGNIKARKAIFTIGLSHLALIIRSLEEEKIRISSSPFGKDQNKDYTSDLNLKKEDFGVMVILPPDLAGDQKILQRTGLGDIIARQRRHSSLGSPSHPGN
jgi:hypothetical protein